MERHQLQDLRVHVPIVTLILADFERNIICNAVVQIFAILM